MFFYEKYNKLYTSVPYNKDDMCDIKSQMNNNIKKGNNTDYVLTVADVVKAIEHRKQGKSGGEEGIWSDNLIHGTHTLYVLMTIINPLLMTLINPLLIHGFSPNSMILGTMVSIPKNKK